MGNRDCMENRRRRNDWDCDKHDWCKDRCKDKCKDKDDKCEKFEKCAKEMSERNQKLIECINRKLKEIICLQEEGEKSLERAARLFEQAEERTKEVECLVRKLKEMEEKRDCCCEKAIKCFKEKCEEEECEEEKCECDFHDCWRCR